MFLRFLSPFLLLLSLLFFFFFGERVQGPHEDLSRAAEEGAAPWGLEAPPGAPPAWGRGDCSWTGRARRAKMGGTDAWPPVPARNPCVPDRLAVGQSKGAALLPNPEAGHLWMVSTRFPMNMWHMRGEGHG